MVASGTLSRIQIMTDRHGPQRTGRFQVEIEGIDWTGWRKVVIPSSSTEQGEYRDGDGPDQEREIWGETIVADLEMERGVQPGDTRIFDWREEIRQGNVDEGLKKVAVILQDEEGEGQLRWEFENAWIKYYDPPTLDASEDDGVATERITVAFERMTREEL